MADCMAIGTNCIKFRLDSILTMFAKRNPTISDKVRSSIRACLKRYFIFSLVQITTKDARGQVDYD